MEQLKPVGFYNSDGQSYCGGPNLRETTSVSPHPDESRIIEYLNQGACVAACGGYAHDFLDQSVAAGLLMHIHTDGVGVARLFGLLRWQVSLSPSC